MPERSFLAITLFSGLAVSIAGTVAAYSLGGAANGPAAASAPVDRAALEQILAPSRAPSAVPMPTMDPGMTGMPGMTP